ncbi:MAG: bifunctional phosphoribosylaminoimidazolecarboxamide formyltransferase/IMP cyclohydrolase [Gammaproteobacteria bacterium]
MNKTQTKITRALLSVSDKTGIVEFAQVLQQYGVEILSTGGTAKLLREKNISVIDVSEVTQFPEMMDGRVKTLHPKLHGGILGLRDTHADVASEHNIPWIDLVVCNLYPFAQTIAREGVTFDEAIENIDVGGPTMVRAAAKNMGWVSVVVDANDYGLIADEIKQHQGVRFETRKQLATKAFQHTAYYDAMISDYLTETPGSQEMALGFNKAYELRYGENPHQTASVYHAPTNHCPSVLRAEILQGKPLSYNNIVDADAALACVSEFDAPACVVVKHANPCGVATSDHLLDAFDQAFHADAKSAFGGIVAFNRPVTEAIAKKLSEVFLEVIIAPEYDANALPHLAKKKNLRVLAIGQVVKPTTAYEFKSVQGGLLMQSVDDHQVSTDALQVVTKTQPTDAQLEALAFAWKVVKHIKSNAILVSRDKKTLGVGAGQVSRIDAVDIALKKAEQHGLENAVLASDAFFPFRDAVDAIADAGIRLIIQPGGSIKDDEVIAACDEKGIAMVFTGVRCFRH